MEYAEKTRWLREARLGMFVHWGMYSVLGRGEQIMARDLIPLDEYAAVAERFEPKAGWAARLAEKAVRTGMKYVVLTTRHHDGYCLFDTTTHDFNAAKTGPGRDLITEYTEAVRAAGLKVGFYYSLLTWRWRGFWDPVKYVDQLPQIIEEVHVQIRELMSNYGKVDVLWYDGGGVPGSPAHGMWDGRRIAQTPAEFWRSAELNRMARELQPRILINNRSGLPEDFGTPEQKVDAEGGGRAWETCMTVNYAPGWGYIRHSMANKTASEVLFNLMDAVRLGGNFLFNVGPRPDGEIDARETDVLEQIGKWMEIHTSAVHDTRPEKIYDLSKGRVQGPMFQYGMWTCRENTGYLTLFYYPGEELVISKIGPAVRSARLLTTGQELSVAPISNGRTLVKGLPAAPPDPLAPVVEVEFEGVPYALEHPGAEWLDGAWSGE